MAVEEGIINLFTQLIQRYTASNASMPVYSDAFQEVNRVRDYLEAHYAKPVTLAQLASLVCISPFHLTRLFARHVGMPPHRYLESIRIRHAERLLGRGTAIAEVAYATGFSGQSHLTRTFKRFIGTTPGAYLKQRKIMQDSR